MDQANEALSEFIRRVLRQKRLSLRDVERNSENAITGSYISKISKGKVRSMTVEKIDALAKGLGVDAFDVFAAAFGKPHRREGELEPMLLIDVLHKVVANPQLVTVIQSWPKMSGKGQAALLQYAEVLSGPGSQPSLRKQRKK